MQTAVYDSMDNLLGGFLAAHRLPQSYADTATRWFLPILDKLFRIGDYRNKTVVIGINGCQGSGKSTLAALAVDLLKTLYGKSAVAMSIDDFYLTLAQRQALAKSVHPLLLTRGVPGTHDLDLAQSTLSSLIDGVGAVKIPQFNKAFDERAGEESWPSITPPVDFIIIEGWCMGALPQPEKDLIQPVNELEEFEDRSGHWRKYVNHQLETIYADFFQAVDIWLMLKAPSFDCVYQWRLEQEEKLKQSLADSVKSGRNDYRVMSPQQIRRFIQYYQRVTEYTLECLPNMAQVVYELDSERGIVGMTDRL